MTPHAFIEIDPNATFHAGRVGKNRTGKTLGLMVEANHYERVIIYDTTKDFFRSKREPIRTASGKEIRLGDHFKIVEGDLRKLSDTIRKGWWQVLYIPKDNQDQSEFDVVASMVYEIGKYLRWNHNLDLKFVVDEIWHFADHQKISRVLKTLMTEGAKENISVRWTAQRLAKTHSDVVTQCRYVDIFNIWARDIEYLHELVEEINKEVIDRLGPYEFLRYDVDARTLIQFGRLD
jgi:hypothetical protein